jgi:IMP cyclohydrolase
LADGVGAEPDGPVGGKELLYRRVDPEKVDRKTGRPVSQAFGPIEKGMSVDRAELCGRDPAHVKDKSTDYVCSATAEAVRGIEVKQIDKKGRVLDKHYGEVKATPLENNKAHADVHEKPEFPNPNMYKKLKARMAETFNWEDKFGP